MLIRYLPLLAGLVPIVGVTAAYWLGVRAGVVPDCVPYLDGCTSISSTGRHLPGSLAFRAALFPQAAVLLFVWWFTATWLRATGNARYARAILVAGSISALALILYVTFLGSKVPFYEFMRRFGIYLYFLGVGVAQLLTSLSLQSSRMRNALLSVALIPWIIGIANLVQKEVLPQPNNVENRIEWWAALAMQIWFVLLHLRWRDVGFQVVVTDRGDSTTPGSLPPKDP